MSKCITDWHMYGSQHFGSVAVYGLIFSQNYLVIHLLRLDRPLKFPNAKQKWEKCQAILSSLWNWKLQKQSCMIWSQTWQYWGRKQLQQWLPLKLNNKGWLSSDLLLWYCKLSTVSTMVQFSCKLYVIRSDLMVYPFFMF